MAAFLSPIGNGIIPFFTSQGVVLAGGQLFTYLAGTTTPQATWTTSAQSVQNPNPIVLGSNALPPQEIWLQQGVQYKFVLEDANNNVLATYDNISGINDTSSNASEWVSYGQTPTYISGTQFSVPGNQTGIFQVGRRVQASISAGTIYGTIGASVFSSVTTVTVGWDSGQLDSGLSAILYGLLGATNPSLPASGPVPISESGNYSVLASDFGRLITESATSTVTLPATSTIRDGWFTEVYNSSTIASPLAVKAVTQGADTIDADAATTVYVLPGETVVFRKFGAKFYTRGRTIKGRIVNVSNFSDGGGTTASTSPSALQNSSFSYQPISPNSVLDIAWSFNGEIASLASNNTIGTFGGYEQTSGNVLIGSNYVLEAPSASGGTGVYVPASLCVYGLSNSALTARTFSLFGNTNNAGAGASAFAIKCEIREIQNA